MPNPVALVLNLLVLVSAHTRGARGEGVPYQNPDPPRLHPLADHHVVPEGQHFSLRCSGHQPVEWVAPEDEAASPEPLSQRIR